VSVLLPVHPYLPIVVSLGSYAHKRSPVDGWDPGIAAELFWGSRSYNYHSMYGMAAGLVLEPRYGIGDAREATWVLAARIDGELIALPFLLLYEAVAHP
jgi:hypothetical protein